MFCGDIITNTWCKNVIQDKVMSSYVGYLCIKLSVYYLQSHGSRILRL